MSISPAKRQTTIVLLITALIFAVIYYSVFDGKLDVNGDNASYYMLGKALANGEGYVNINDINKVPHSHFPPGYPVIISSLIKTFGESTSTIKLTNGFLLLCTLMVLYLLIKEITSRESTAIIVLILMMLNSHLLMYSTIIMTEIPFLFFSILAIYAFLKVNYNKPIWRDSYFYATILLLTISFYIRTSGLALMIGLVLYLLLTKHWKHALIIILAVGLFATPWQLRNQKLGGSTYIKQLQMVNPYRPELGKAGFGDYATRFSNNVSRYLTKEIPAATVSFVKANYRQAASLGQWLFAIAFFMIIIFGVLTLKKYKLLILTYLAGTLIILLLWPDVWVGIRFILPTVPFLLLGMVHGLQELLTKITPRVTHRYIVWLPVLIALLLFPGIKKLHQNARQDLKPEWANYYSLAEWSKENLADSSVIACRKPHLFYLNSNRFTVNYKYTENGQSLIDDLIDKQVDYVVMDQLGYSSTFRYLYPVIQNYPDRFELVHEINDPQTYIFRFKPQ